ncbi:glycosyltransferase [Desulfobacca acetoxidans]|uniref:Glycosyl transferase group 1 n=1 Tax=Desulfobacca acetoxidans (strain ATCC 700848 / DSM 11109 / ASRB2) TaxID=880072 RepID=F2NJJ1_DESAR|nr:glycosyltransferase [Desulfobacca acetoxidans]AEB09503.1 glycosyl transferase group 1 [Desulfobacca acetoxidans DSM 11109]
MKILHITGFYEPAWHLGGVVRSVSQLCRGLARLGHEVTVFTTDSGMDRRLDVPVNRPVDVGGVTVYYFKTDFFLKFAYSRSLGQACRRLIKNFDLMHLTAFWCYPGIPAGVAARQQEMPYLVSVHGTLRKAALQHKAWKKWIYFWAIEKRNVRGAAALHYTTAMERELDAFHRFPVPSFIVPNGLEVQEFQELPEKIAAKANFGLNPQTQVVTFLGRLHQIKNLDLLMKGMSEIGLNGKELVLLLAGPDAGAEISLKNLAESSGLNSHVKFLGPVDAVGRRNLLAASDLMALVSSNENFGNAVVEAMLAGVPVLVSEHVGICREVQADGAGLVVPLKVEAIAQGLKQMLSDPARLKAMGQAAAAAARRRYDIDIVAQQMATAYEDILTGRRRPGLNWSDSQVEGR